MSEFSTPPATDPTAEITAAVANKADRREVATAVARLALTGLTRGARVYQTDTGFWYELTNAAAPSDAASWRPEPKKYFFSATQTGTDAPTVTVWENTVGAIVWTYADVGQYTGTLAGAFLAGKVPNKTGFCDGLAEGAAWGISRATDDTVSLGTMGTPGDTYNNGKLANTYVELLVYP